MGNRSTINNYSWNNIDKFLKNLTPYYDTENMLILLPEGYRELTEEQKLISTLMSVGGRIKFSMPQMYINEDGLLIDLDDWKIHGYWYDDLCNMLTLFHELGLRGHIHMTEECDQDFDIRLNDDGVEVEIWEAGEDQDSTIHIIKEGGLRWK